MKSLPYQLVILLVLVMFNIKIGCAGINHWTIIPTQPFYSEFLWPRLVVNPHNPDQLYTLGAFSNDRGCTWQEYDLPDTLEHIYLEMISIDPFYPDTLFIGAATRTWYIRSLDGGLDWEILPVTDESDPSWMQEPLSFVNGLPGRIWAATTLYGAWFSDDLGETWTQRSEGMINGYITKIAVHPTNPDILYAISRPYEPAEDSWVYKSTDRGLHWDLIMNGIPWEEPSHIDFNDIAIDPQNPEIVYLAGHEWIYSVYKTVNGGQEWFRVDENLPGNLCWEKKLLINPLHPNILYLVSGLWESSPPNVTSVFRSLDGGATWEELLDGLPHGDGEYHYPYGFALAADDDEVTLFFQFWDEDYQGEDWVYIYEYTDTTTVDAVAESAVQIPQGVSLGQNYPNPFNPATTIEFTLEYPARVNLSVYDMRGRLVSGLNTIDEVSGHAHDLPESIKGWFPAGEHSVQFNGDNLPSGIYFYRLEAAGQVRTRKMLLFR